MPETTPPKAPRRLRASRTVRLVSLVLIALAYLFADRFGVDPTTASMRRWMEPVAWLVLWISAFQLLNWLCRQYVLDAVSHQWLGEPLPRLFGDIFSALLFLGTIALIAQTAFGAALVPLYATSGVLTIVLGLALQSIILDLFVGFAIHVDHPFRIGDWLRLENGTEAEVIALTWRTVQLRTVAAETMFIPNGELGRAQFVNLSADDAPVRFSHSFILEYDVKPERGFRMVRAAMQAAVGDDGILANPQPQVVIQDTNQQGTHFFTRWWMYPYRPHSPSAAKSRVITSVIDHLQAAGLGIALPITVSPRDLPHVPVVKDEKDRHDLLRLNRLMEPLSEELVAALDPELSVRLIEKGTVLADAGALNETVSMVLEGMLVARVQHPTSGDWLQAFRLEPGSYFGEHVLDGGRPSLVSVVAEAESVVVDLQVQRAFELMEATPELAEEVRATHRERQALIYEASRIERVADVQTNSNETAIESVMRNLAGRARSIRPRGNRLLVVDDSRLQRHQLAEIAVRAGWQVCAEASDGVEAVGLYRDLRPDLVTMDLVMPRKDGIEALADIKAFHAGARVLMVSAVDQPQKLEKALALGAIDFVVKPYDPPVLRDTFERLLDSKDHQQQRPPGQSGPQGGGRDAPESASQPLTSGVPRVLA